MRALALVVLCALLAGCSFAPSVDGPPPDVSSPTPAPTSSERAPPEGERLWSRRVAASASTLEDDRSIRHPLLAEDAEGRTLFLAALTARGNGSPRLAVHALDAANGEPLWNHTGEGERRHVSALLHHPAEGLVLVATDGLALTALDARTGAPRWEKAAGEGSYSDLALAPDGTVFAAGRDVARRQAVLTAMDPKDGAQKWSVLTGRPGVLGSAALVLAPDGRTAYVASEGPMHPGPSILFVAAHDAGNGTPRWSKEIGAYPAVGPLLLHDPPNGTLLVTSNEYSRPGTYVHALRDEDGSFLWRTSLPQHRLDALVLSPDRRAACVAGTDGATARTDCLRTEDGAALWNASHPPTRDGRLSYSHGLSFTRDGARLLVLVTTSSWWRSEGRFFPNGGEVMLVAHDFPGGDKKWTVGWEHALDHGAAGALHVSRQAARAYVASEGNPADGGNVTVQAIGLGG